MAQGLQQQIVIIYQLINNAYIYSRINSNFKYEKYINRQPTYFCNGR
jgi:hypothetical protein